MKPIQLIVKKLDGTLSGREEQLFDQWLQESEKNQIFFSKVADFHMQGGNVSALTSLDPKLAWKRVIQKYGATPNPKKLHRPTSFFKYAAIFACIIALGYGYFRYPSTKELKINEITLELGNGEVRVLSHKDTNVITDTQGNILGKKKGSKLDYKDVKVGEKLIFNTLKVPYGKTFAIDLSDGTTVHLNAGSSLRYPVKFLNDKSRRVFLKGEAFFDVSKDKEHPFVVSTSEMEVTVLGTEFNMTAYPEDTFVNTVLLEGSVSLSSAQNEKEQGKELLRLEPGYKAQWDIGSRQVKAEKVDTEIYTGWISGKLLLKGLPFKNIIKRLERHYNVTIKNNYKYLDNQIFTASFEEETIDEVLDTFTENKKFKFERINNIITINKP